MSASGTILPKGAEFMAAVGVSFPGDAWFCVRAQPKHEHIAAAHLAREMQVETFLPRISFKRSTKTGPAWVTEALFPGYLFARFQLQEALRRVQHARGVRGVVHFGNRWPTVPDVAIEELRRRVGDRPVMVVEPDLKPGDQVQIAGGAFHGWDALISRIMPGRERVAVLLDFLGRQTTVELEAEVVVPKGDQRQVLL